MLDIYKDMSKEQWLSLLPFGIACALAGYGIKTLIDEKKKSGGINESIQKNESKVVHTTDIEDIGEKAVFCRCWKSSKFPYCDGSHNKHNVATGDNVGPLIVKKKQ